MFGYVRAFVPELKVRQHEYYRGTYCGLCKAMGSCTGQCSRLSLSYDFVLFTLLRLTLTDSVPSFEQKRCFLHPLKKRNVMKKNTALEHSAYSSALLSYRKIRDDISDEGFSKRLISRIFLLPSASGMRRKTFRRSDEYKVLDKACEEILLTLSRYEKDETALPSVDYPAGIFGSLLGEFLSFGLDEKKKRVAASAGMHLGKWIYIADALDDMNDDQKLKRFNPFLRLFGRIPNESELEGIVIALKNELIELESAIDLMDLERSKNTTQTEIIRNIIYLGMPKRIEEIIKKYNNDRKDD